MIIIDETFTKIGAGAFGAVFTHPSMPGICLKVVPDRTWTVADEFENLVKAHALMPDLFPKPGELVEIGDVHGEVFQGYTMEYVPMKSLQQQRLWDEYNALEDILYDVMSELGILHKDLNSGNILYNPDTGDFKVIDTGRMSVA